MVLKLDFDTSVVPYTLSCFIDAADGVDFFGVNSTLDIPAGACIGLFTLTLVDDHTFEELEQFSYTIISNDPKILVNATHSSATVYLVDQDGKCLRAGGHLCLVRKHHLVYLTYM